MWGNPYKVVDTRGGGYQVLYQEEFNVEPVRMLPYPVTTRARANECAVMYYRWFLEDHPVVLDRVRKELRGRDLVCWCALDMPCHADVLLAVANPAQECDGTDEIAGNKEISSKP
jgi:hypothetical protein